MKFMQTSEHFNLNDQKFFHRIIHVYVSIRLFDIFIQLYGSMLCIPNFHEDSSKGVFCLAPRR